MVRVPQGLPQLSQIVTQIRLILYEIGFNERLSYGAWEGL